MSESKSLKVVAILLMVLPILVILFRIDRNGGPTQLGAEHKYVINYQFDFEFDRPYQITTFLPVNNRRQEIHLNKSESSVPHSVFLEGINKLIQWRGTADNRYLTYQY
ncbi:MAG: hypothetical protein HRT61_16765 [Ekhidna sp.]|nr:hypothetical protein [Ekhidna sp.]